MTAAQRARRLVRVSTRAVSKRNHVGAFIRGPRINSESHRNRSVPHNLQVWQLYRELFTHSRMVYFSLEQLTFICIIYIVASYENIQSWSRAENFNFTSLAGQWIFLNFSDFGIHGYNIVQGFRRVKIKFSALGEYRDHGKVINSNILWYFHSHKKQRECIYEKNPFNELLKKHRGARGY
jgi:hypothetical protein